MPDPRFFEDHGPVRLADIATWTGSQLSDPAVADRMIASVSILNRADPSSVTFLADRRHADALADSRAGACFVTPGAVDTVPPGCAALLTARPQAAYAAVARRLHTPRPFGTEAIAVDAVIEAGAQIAAGVCVGSGAHIGRGTHIGPNTVVGPGVAIGRDCRIGPNVSIGFALIGDRVMILAGAVIGEAGFGATVGEGGVVDIPQLGRVILQDGVTLGANTTVDRGAFEDTVIGENTKIDNLVQIAHNVRIGRNCVMAAQSGISGSVTIGDGAQFGGRAGVADHVTIGAGARLGAGSGAMKDIPAGETWSGVPARPLRDWLKETAWLARAVSRKGGNA